MKRIMMTLALATVLLGFNSANRSLDLPFGLSLGPSEANADSGFVFYYGVGGHRQGYHAKHGKHHYKGDDHGYRGGHHKKHHGHHKKHRRHKKHHGHHNKHHGHHKKHHAARHGYGHGGGYGGYDACHQVSKAGYWHGRYARIGGTMCYDRKGYGYVVDGSRYLIHYY